MWISMGLLKNEHGVFVVRRKVPKVLEHAVALVLGRTGKQRQTFLQQSLRTKDKDAAKRLAAPVLMEFDRVLRDAEVLAKPKALKARDTLTAAEVKQIADYHFATRLANDAAFRREGWRYVEGGTASGGLSDAQFEQVTKGYTESLAEAKAALARGNLNYIAPEVDELLSDTFSISVDRNGPAYRAVAAAVLSSEVKALETVLRRHAGDAIDTPKQPEPLNTESAEGETLGAALAGWKKERVRSPGTLLEYERAIALFTELHGNLAVTDIKRSHARQFREALQEIPRHRAGKLASAKLPELAEWGKENPKAQKLNPATVNKLFGGVQTVVVWARDKGGMVPDDVPWADPFSKMRLEESDSERDPFEMDELNRLFASPVFTEGSRPVGGKGEAAFWLPLLGLFTGARRGELAALTVSDVASDVNGATVTFTEDRESGKTLKTRASRRLVPLHQKLIALGFFEFVKHTREARGAEAWLFPLIAPDVPGGAKAWTKWFSRYIRGDDVAIDDTTKVFHSTRHNFKDGLRAGGVGEDVVDALAGHGTRGTVARGYGAKDMVRRFGMPMLTSAIDKIEFPNLDLTAVKPWRAGAGSRDGKRPTSRRGISGQQRETTK